MNSRADILQKVRAARPLVVELPSLGELRKHQSSAPTDLYAQFMNVARAGGTTVVEVERSDVASTVTSLYADAEHVLSTVVDVPAETQFSDDLREIANADLYVCEGTLGVAQDGAVLMIATDARERAALFLAEHVVMLLDRNRIVATTHDVYEHFDVRSHRFAVLVAGPSKTADIEQSLVIGAHGPMSLTVLLVS